MREICTSGLRRGKEVGGHWHCASHPVTSLPTLLLNVFKFSSFSRRGPDNITEELVAALSCSKSYEFKALFSVIHAALRARNAASGGEEMLRLRTYDKLQSLVRLRLVQPFPSLPWILRRPTRV